MPDLHDLNSDGSDGSRVAQRFVTRRHDLCLRPDATRVLLRPFRPTAEPRDRNPIDKPRVNHIVDRIMALSADVATAQLDEIIERFARRHRDLLEMMDTRAAKVDFCAGTARHP